MRSASRTMKERGDVERARENLERLQQELDDLQQRFEQEVKEQTSMFDIHSEKLRTYSVRPQKSNINVRLFNFIWVPFWRTDAGMVKPGY